MALLPELRLDEVTRPLTPFGGAKAATTTAPRRPSLVPPRPVSWGVTVVPDHAESGRWPAPSCCRACATRPSR